MGRGSGSGPTYLDTPEPTPGSGPPIRDHDALLTIQFNFVQVASGPTVHHKRQGPSGEDAVRMIMTTAMIRAAKIN